jgi:radical SAM protein with 4Fe4S-binding SPASM domain
MSTEVLSSCLQHPATEPFCTGVPQVVSVAITGRCELHCLHCYAESGPDHGDELPLSVIEQLLDEVAGWGVHHIRLTGGEPTVHPRFRDVLDACRSRNIGLEINTHACFSPQLFSYLQAPPIEQFLISVDGMEASNDAIRGRGTFRRAIESARLLRRAGQQVMLSCHVGEMNRAAVSPLTELAASLGVNIKFSPIRAVGRAARAMPDGLIGPESYLEVVKAIVRLRTVFPDIRILTDFDLLGSDHLWDHRPDPARAACKAGRRMIHVNCDGGIYPCAFLVTPGTEFRAGSIYQSTVTEVWQQSPIFVPFRTQTKSMQCQSCRHYRRQCVGGCVAVAYADTGFLDAHDRNCFAHLLEPMQQQRS